jgi:chemotaxis protein methyltransferase CheR
MMSNHAAIPPAGSSTLSPLTDDSEAISALATLIWRETGIEIGANRHAMIRSRLARRMRTLGLDTITAYRDLVLDSTSEELPHLISCLTTNVSSFFREPHHFDLLIETARTTLLPRLAKQGRVRLWSAGCALGQEAWTMAMVLSDLGLTPDRGDVRILATDIDPIALQSAAAGRYTEAMLEGLPPERRRSALIKDPETNEWSVAEPLRRLLTFRELNLIRPFPVRGPFDVIFCRNVMIYFDDRTQVDLCRRLAAVLGEGGLLCIGHSERIAEDLTPLFTGVGLTAYRRTSVAVPPADTHISGRMTHGAA